MSLSFSNGALFVLQLKNRLKLLELSREDELLKAIETSSQYCRLLHSGQVCRQSAHDVTR